jgi:hypothetical protein
MKKYFIFSLLILLANRQFAQIEKGTLVPGIIINGYYSNALNKDTIRSSVDNQWRTGFNMTFGKFIKENLLMSFTLGDFYSSSNSKSESVPIYFNNYSNKQISNAVSAGVSLSKFKFINEVFAVSFGPSFSFGFADGKSTRTIFEKHYDSNNNLYYTQSSISTYENSILAQIYLSAGIRYFISKNLSINGSLGFFSASYTTSPYLTEKKHSEQNYLAFSLTPSFNAFGAGLTYYIRPKTETK